MKTAFENLREQLRQEGITMGCNWQIDADLPNPFKLECFMLHGVEEGRPMLAIIQHFPDGQGYELWLPSTSNSIADDVARIVGD